MSPVDWCKDVLSTPRLGITVAMHGSTREQGGGMEAESKPRLLASVGCREQKRTCMHAREACFRHSPAFVVQSPLPSLAFGGRNSASNHRRKLPFSTVPCAQFRLSYSLLLSAGCPRRANASSECYALPTSIVHRCEPCRSHCPFPGRILPFWRKAKRYFRHSMDNVTFRRWPSTSGPFRTQDMKISPVDIFDIPF